MATHVLIALGGKMKTLIVCGYGTQKSEWYRNYVAQAREYACDHGFDVIIFAGGITNLSNPELSEAVHMYTMYQQLPGSGVDDFNIFAYELGRTLEENIWGAHQLMWKEFRTSDFDKIAVVVKDSHKVKALWYLKRFFGWKNTYVVAIQAEDSSFVKNAIQAFVALPFEWLASKIGFVSRWRMRLREKRMRNS